MIQGGKTRLRLYSYVQQFFRAAGGRAGWGAMASRSGAAAYWSGAGGIIDGLSRDVGGNFRVVSGIIHAANGIFVVAIGIFTNAVGDGVFKIKSSVDYVLASGRWSAWDHRIG